MGLKGHIREEPPVELFDELKQAHHDRMGPGILKNRSGVLFQFRERARLPADDLVAQKGEQLMFGCGVGKFNNIFHNILLKENNNTKTNLFIVYL
jgi:hypothetical protein